MENIETVPFNLEVAREKFVKAKSNLFIPRDEIINNTTIGSVDCVTRSVNTFTTELQTYMEAELELLLLEQARISHGQEIDLSNVNSTPSPFDFDKRIGQLERAISYLKGESENPKHLQEVGAGLLNDRKKLGDEEHKRNVESCMLINLIVTNMQGLNQEKEGYERENEFLKQSLSVLNNEPHKFKKNNG